MMNTNNYDKLMEPGLHVAVSNYVTHFNLFTADLILDIVKRGDNGTCKFGVVKLITETLPLDAVKIHAENRNELYKLVHSTLIVSRTYPDEFINMTQFIGEYIETAKGELRALIIHDLHPLMVKCEPGNWKTAMQELKDIATKYNIPIIAQLRTVTPKNVDIETFKKQKPAFNFNNMPKTITKMKLDKNGDLVTETYETGKRNLGGQK